MAGVPQGSVLGPVLYLLYINDVPTTSSSTMAAFADNIAVMAIGETVDISTRKLQSAVNKVAIWTRKWQIKLNESKSIYIDFTIKKIRQQPILINATKVPYANTAKYLDVTLDAKLRWKERIKKKCDELNIKFQKMNWLLGHNSELSVHNKLTLYKQVIHPVWSYGIQLWDCTSDFNIQVIQRYQNKVLKRIVNAPWYVRNSGLHCDLGIGTVTDIIAKFARSQEKRLQDHINIEAYRLLNVNKITKRL
jgi:hypothetical protein